MGEGQPVFSGHFHLGCYLKVLSHQVGLPVSVKVIQSVSQVTLPPQVTLICGKLTFNITFRYLKNLLRLT